MADRRLGWLMLLGGLVGWVAAFVLAVEKYALLADPSYVPTCSINPVLSCGSVIASEQSEVFGFPNPLVGVGGFAVLAASGAAVLAGAHLAHWYWAGLQAGTTAAVVFVHWLVFSSLYRIGALCPYCMAVWIVTITVFWYVTVRNLEVAASRGPVWESVAVTARRWHGVVLTVWFLLIAAAVVQRFWLYWSTLA